MNQLVEIDSNQQQLKTIGHISYFLHALVAVAAVVPGANASVLILLVAFALDMFYRDRAIGTWQQSHFSWRIRTVLWAGALYLLTLPLFLLLWIPGAIAWTLISIWFLYRVARGWLNLSSNTAMPA